MRNICLLLPSLSYQTPSPIMDSIIGFELCWGLSPTCDPRTMIRW